MPIENLMRDFDREDFEPTLRVLERMDAVMSEEYCSWKGSYDHHALQVTLELVRRLRTQYHAKRLREEGGVQAV